MKTPFRYQVLAGLLLVTQFAAHAVELCVATNGNDLNPGTEQKPLRTIQVAVNRMQSGDVCQIQTGTYREAVKISKSGTPVQPILIQAAPGAKVLFDGTETVAGKWTKYKGNIYQIKEPKGIQQLFVGNKMMMEARWPNMRSDQVFNRDCWAKTDKGSGHGRVVSKEIAENGIDWTGAMACLNVAHQWWTWNRPIVRHQAGSDTLEYDADLVGLCYLDPKVCKNQKLLDEKWANNSFYLYGKLEALDVQTEWFQDQTNGMLYFFAPGGVDPSTLEVRYKVRDYAIYATNQNYLKIKGINFFATTFRLDDCNGCAVENCELLYPTYSRTITEYDHDRRESIITKVTGDNNTVRHCSLAYANNLGLMVMGNSNLVDNCIIHDVNWSGTLIYPALQLSASPHLGVNWFDTIQYPPTERTIANSDATSYGNVARHNTLYNAGSALLVYQAANSRVEYNHVYDGGKACKDVSLIYGCWPFSHDSIVSYNWVHGCVTEGYSGHWGDGGIGIRADDQSRHNIFHHNVVWNCGEIGITMKGEDNLCYNNTVFSIGTGAKPQMDILLETNAEPVKIWAVRWPQLLMQNQWSEIVNNAARNITSSHSPNAQRPDNTYVYHNFRNQDARALLKDPDRFDFRPADRAPLIDAGAVLPGYTDGFKGSAPDLGAYESGGDNWKPGADWQESFTISK